MGQITLITGGARSGKSTFAEKSVREKNKRTAYLATAIAFDESMKSRIEKHVNQRPSEWTTFEKATKAHEVVREIASNHEVLLLDCITVLMTNTLFMDDLDWDTIDEKTIDRVEGRVMEDIKLLISALKESDLQSYLVTNEVGSGIVPENRLARIFRDIAGRINQYIASQADEVYAVISGLPLKLKG